jgi:hypothetical protein
MLKIIQQEIIENTFNRKLINQKIKEVITDEYSGFISSGVRLLSEWLGCSYYSSKNVRLELVKALDLKELVTKMLVEVAHCQHAELFTSVSAKLAGALGWTDKPDAIKTMAEMLAIIADTDAYDIKRNEVNSFVIKSRMQFSTELTQFIENTMYLPPMLVEPHEVKTNIDTGYLTLKDSLVLGKGNFHTGDLCLDAINIANSVKLKLDTAFVSKVEMLCTFKVKEQEQLDQFNTFKKNSYKLMSLLATNGNEFWLTHRVDKRGRLYSQGYHVHTQSNAFGKSCIEFADEEVVIVPAEYSMDYWLKDGKLQETMSLDTPYGVTCWSSFHESFGVRDMGNFHITLPEEVSEELKTLLKGIV